VRIKIRDISLFFDIDGIGLTPDGSAMREKPTIVLIHGGPGFDHSGFKPAFSTLTDIAQIVYLDVRGCGRSGRGDPSRWRLGEWAEDVATLCDTLGIIRPFIFGLSFGGYVAMQLAVDFPQLPGGLILSSTTAHLRIDRALAVFERLGGEHAREVAAAFWQTPNEDTFCRYVEICFPLYNLRPASPEAYSRVIINRELLFRFFSPGEEGRTFDLRSRLREVSCPTLLLAGRDDPITTIEDAQEIAAALPAGTCRFEIFEDCRHGVTRDAPERAFPIIREFVSSVTDERQDAELGVAS